MRMAALSFLACGLAACGGGAGDVERVSLPLKSPDGAHNLVADFVDICSLYLADRNASLQLAKSRGWQNDSVGADMAAQFTGMSVLSHDDYEGNLQLIPASYPHLDTWMCMIFVPDAEYIEGEIGLDVIHGIDGLQGGFLPMPTGEAHGVGRWSFVAENDQIVLVNAIQPTDQFIQLNMSTHKEKYPK